MRHDLAGPGIGRLRRGKYTKQLVREFRTRALAAIQAGEIDVSSSELDFFCAQAANDLIRIREIRAAHEAGRLPTQVMQQLPAYAAFKAYLDEEPSLVMCETIAAALGMEKLNEEEVDPKPLAQPRHPKYPLSTETRAWMDVRALGLALADDTGGPAVGNIAKEDYITDSALRVRKQVRHAISIGDLVVPPMDVDHICWTVACEAYLLRSLKAAKQAGELTLEDIKKMPIYVAYRDYFEIGADLVAGAMRIAAIVEQIRPPGAQN